ncbi:MAG: hypothetical protein V4622_07715 [Bacteroidota bacterium]
MKNIKIIVALVVGFGISSFVYEMKLGNKPKKIYREGDSKIVVWENFGKDSTIWLQYQVEKEYKKDDEIKYTNKFNEKELLDLKKALDLAITDIQTKK